MTPNAGSREETTAAAIANGRSGVATVYVVVAGAAFAVFIGGALLLAITVPYHDWDAFAFGDWSRRIASGGSIDPLTVGLLGAARPLFYLLQGAVWSATGVSFTAGRILSLCFVVVLVVSIAALARDRRAAPSVRRLQAGLAVLCVLSVTSFAQQSVAGLSDIPAAAMLAAVGAVTLLQRETRRMAVVLALLTSGAMLTKPTVFVPLLGLGAWLLIDRSRPLAVRVRWSVIPFGVGFLLGLGYQGLMASRFHVGLFEYLRTGTTEGLWAQRAAAARWDAILRLDVFGAGLRLPLAFAIVYGLLRATAVSHRRASSVAFSVALVWGIVGPFAVGVQGGPFASAELILCLVGFAIVLLAVVVADGDTAPPRDRVTALTLLGLPPLLVWIYATPYSDRLAATAWPGLVALIAICLATGVRSLGRLGFPAALAPIPILLVALWISISGLDGFHGAMWTEYRSLGRDGVWDEGRAMNIVLPSVQSALALAAPSTEAGGRISVADPRFQFFLPDRVTTTTALHCADVAGFAVFVLDTSDESKQLARDAGGLSEPVEWAACRSPRLEQLSDGSNGFAVFAVHG